MVSRILRTWALNCANSAVFLASGGSRVLHEGRYRRGRWSDWCRAFGCRPQRFVRAENEAAVRRLVRDARTVRVVGAGHSFNEGPLSDDLLLSLDRLDRVQVRDDPDHPGWKIAAVQAGVRLRDLNRVLHDHGAALSVAGSTDPQSIGGLIATDVHGSGRDHGFLSEALLSLRVVDARGEVRDVRPGDELFAAAIGGAGTCGVVVAAEVRCEPAYNLAKSVKVVRREWAERNLDALLQEHDHLSFYYFGGLSRSEEQDTDVAHVRMNTWDRTLAEPDPLRRVGKVKDELFDMAFSGHLLGLARALHVADRLARVVFFFYRLAVNSRSVVHPAGEGFSRLLYFRHDEIEYGVPYESLLPCLRDVRALLRRRHFPSVIELRFTPDTSQALLGPGSGRRTAFVELAASMSRPTDPVFREFERIVLEHGGQPHLGKKVYLDHDQMVGVHGPERMRRFEAVRRAQDPTGTFLNPLTERVLAPRRAADPVAPAAPLPAAVP